jgi:hypothetical protein
VEIKKVNLPQSYKVQQAKSQPFIESEFQEPKDTAEIEGKKPQALKLPKSLSLKAETRAVQPKKKWTILVYAAADNNLLQATEKSMDDLESVGSNAQANMVVQFDYSKSKGIQRFYLKSSPHDGKITSKPLEKLGAGNMADPKLLADFIKWGIKNYPSDHVMVIISDHGDGWKGAIDDEGHQSWMSTPNIAKALKAAEKETGKKVGFDACLMAAAETAYELKDAARYMVASQEIIELKGLPFSKLFNEKALSQLSDKIKGKLNQEPEAMAKELVNSVKLDPNSVFTMSAIDLTHMEKLAASIDKLAVRIKESKVPPEAIKHEFNKAQAFESMRDLYDLADRLEKSPKIDDHKLKEAAAQVKKDLKAAVIAEQHTKDYPGAHGLHIETSTKDWHSQYGTDYLDTAFTKDTNWDEAISYLDKKYLA